MTAEPEKVEGPYLRPGTKVRYDGGEQVEFGVVIHTWVEHLPSSEPLAVHDCYVVFFGNMPPSEDKPRKQDLYILRYPTNAFTILPDDAW